MRRVKPRHVITLPRWLSGLIFWCIDWWGKRSNRKFTFVLATVLIVTHLPYGFHHVTTYRMAAQCRDLGYVQAMQRRFGCEELACTDDKAVYVDAMEVALGFTSQHCGRDGPPRPDQLITRYASDLIQVLKDTSDPDGLLPFEPEPELTVAALPEQP